MRWHVMSATPSPLRIARPNPRPAHPITPISRSIAPRVLVVEDEMTVAMLIEDMVSELAYDVAAVVPRLEDAMRLLDTDSFDLAMLDVHLNGKTVFPFAKALEERGIPFLFATAYGPRGIPAEFQGHMVLAEAVRSGGIAPRPDWIWQAAHNSLIAPALACAPSERTPRKSRCRRSPPAPG